MFINVKTPSGRTYWVAVAHITAVCDDPDNPKSVTRIYLSGAADDCITASMPVAEVMQLITQATISPLDWTAGFIAAGPVVPVAQKGDVDAPQAEGS